jgi:outer membrane immunogenic protein
MLRMRWAALAAMVLAAPAAAGDGGGPPPTNYWTGFYIGAHLGGGVDGGPIYTYTEDGNFEPKDRPRDAGFTERALFGGHGGYLHQFGYFAAGIEGSFSTGLEGELKENAPPKGNDYQTRSESDALYSVTGRAGLTFDRFFLYGKAGYAWSDVDFSASFYNKDGPPIEIDGKMVSSNGTKTSISHNFDAEGAVYGAGLEFALNNQFSIGVEYLRYDFGSSDVVSLDVAGPACCGDEKVKADLGYDTVTVRGRFKLH